MKLSGGKKQSSNCSMRPSRIIFLIFYLISHGWLLACNQPKISIITSIFRGDFFIEHFLADITRQTVFADCELILINANPPGTGHELDEISKYLSLYPGQIIYKQLAQDPGIYGVWNLGIKLARGKYITNANLDDRLAPDCYAVHAQVLDQNINIDLVYSNSYVTNIANQNFENHHSIGLINCPEFAPKNIKLANLPSFNPMWRKTVHDRFGYFDEQFKIAGDWEFWVRIIAGGAKFKKASGVHGLFYYNPKGLSSNQDNSKEHLAERALVYQKHKQFFA